MTLSETDMIRMWLLRKGFEPLRSDCRIERSDGADLEEYARRECSLWYDRLLREGDTSLLVLHDMSSAQGLTATVTDAGSVIYRLPEEIVRPVAVKLSSWRAPATIVTADHPLALRQYLPFGSAGPVHPVAIWLPGNRLELFSLTYEGENADTLEYLQCVIRRYEEDGRTPIYEFREGALATL